MRSQPPASRQSLDWDLDGELHGRMDDCLAAEVAADWGRNESGCSQSSGDDLRRRRLTTADVEGDSFNRGRRFKEEFRQDPNRRRLVWRRQYRRRR
ncbi:hypothetical protein V6N13_108041 [Hibiscus sabdariffa]